MHMLDLVTDIVMASSSSSVGMEISEPFRTEDLSKTDFFDFVTGSAPDMAITSSSGGGGGGNNNNNSGSCTRVMTGIVSGPIGGSTVTDRPPGRNGPGDHSDGSPANRGSSMNTSAASNNGPSDGNDQPLQGFDQFWGSDKDVNRLDPGMFEDLNRYCWIQQNNNNNTSSANNNNSNNSNNGVLNNQMADTDGQIYTLTVLNGTPEPWVLRKDPNTTEPTAPASNLDLDTILGGFPGYVKTECFSYDDSGFGTDHHAKEDPHQQQQQQHQQHLLVQQQHTHSQLQQVQPQQQQQQQQQMPVSSSNIVLSSNLLDPNSVLAYQNNNNNNNDWQMSDHNVIQQETPESLLRSALQGKGYTKGTGMQLQNGGGTVTVLQSPGHMKDEELRRVLYSTGDPSDSLSAYADSTLTNGMYDDSVLHSPASTNQSLPTALQQHQEHQQHSQQVQSQMTSGVTQTGQQVAGDMSAGGGGEAGGGGGPTATSVVVDDMFLTLDAAFTEDYEKLKRIETEVQQFCSDNNNYTEIIVETGPIGTLPSANSNHVNSTGNLLITATTTSTGPNQHHPHHQGAGSGAAMVLTPVSVGSVGLSAPRQPTVSTTTSSDVVTTTSPTKAKAPRAKKSYKRSLSSNANSNAGGNQAGSTTGNPQLLSSPTSTNLTCLATSNNNNTTMNNLNTLSGGGMLSPTGGAGSGATISSGGNSTTTTTTTSPTQCGNGGGGTGVGGGQQRKERSLHYCSICSKGFKDKYSVNVHIRTHTGEKPFACSLCGKSFRQKAHLAKHYQTHLAQKNPAGGGTAGGGTVSKQSKQSRLAAPPPSDPVTSGQLTSPVSGPTAAPPPSLPNELVSSLTVVQSGSPPMLLNTAAATVTQIVASR
ncbi:ichor-like [Anopheles aquasalis]|uniref:ichor-like n=1 Tax=Anopheles aquasalis TaxID=42839 RepID=UPI00215A927A|nr:ichor-like [Anopheles aquasalis]